MSNLETVKLVEGLVSNLKAQMLYKQGYDKAIANAENIARTSAIREEGNDMGWWKYMKIPPAFRLTPMTQTAIKRRAMVIRELLLQIYEEDT